MAYQIPQTDLNTLGAALADYYAEEWQEGIKGLADKIAQAGMKPGTRYLDEATDAFANLKKSSKDKFGVTFKADLQQHVRVYFANKFDVASDLVNVAEGALKLLAGIAIPHLGPLVVKALCVTAEQVSFLLEKFVDLGQHAATGKTISSAAHPLEDALHKRSIATADKQLAGKTGGELDTLFTNDKEAADSIQKSMDQYKLICKYIQTMPTNISSYDDAVTFPRAVFKVQAAASSLNISLYWVQQYLAAMQNRLKEIQSESSRYINQVRTDMPNVAKNVLQTAYNEAYQKGEADIAKNKYAAPREPKFEKPPSNVGGATQLAAYLAHAVAQGYYDSGNRGPQIARPRAVAVTGPQPFVRHA